MWVPFGFCTLSLSDSLKQWNNLQQKRKKYELYKIFANRLSFSRTFDKLSIKTELHKFYVRMRGKHYCDKIHLKRICMQIAG